MNNMNISWFSPISQELRLEISLKQKNYKSDCDIGPFSFILQLRQPPADP